MKAISDCVGNTGSWGMVSAQFISNSPILDAAEGVGNCVLANFVPITQHILFSLG
jgi:hypothetical protein